MIHHFSPQRLAPISCQVGSTAPPSDPWALGPHPLVPSSSQTVGSSPAAVAILSFSSSSESSVNRAHGQECASKVCALASSALSPGLRAAAALLSKMELDDANSTLSYLQAEFLAEYSKVSSTVSS